MAKFDCKFNLRHPNSKEKTGINLRLNFDNQELWWNLKDNSGRWLKIYPQLWDSQKQYPIAKGKIPKKYQSEIYNSQMIETAINKVKVFVNEIINQIVLGNRKITKNLLHSELLLKVGLTKKQKEITLYQFCSASIKDMENGTLLKKPSNTKYTEGTIKAYKVLQTALSVFKPTSTFNDINRAWYDEFILFLTNPQHIPYTDEDGKEQIYKNEYRDPDSVGNYIKNLKPIMRLAVGKEVSTNTCYNNDWFIKPRKDKKKRFGDIYLTEEEIQRIYDFEITQKGKTQLAKDLFLIGCYTALRVSDFNKGLTPADFTDITTNNNETIKVLIQGTQKTGELVYIPLLLDQAKAIFEKYNYTLPFIEDQTINIYIKNICENIGNSFNDTEHYYEVVNTKETPKESKKWEQVSTKIGRKSLITNLGKRGFTEKEISHITGHKPQGVMATHYDKLSPKDKAIYLYNKFHNKPQIS